jgi:cell division protein ZapD
VAPVGPAVGPLACGATVGVAVEQSFGAAPRLPQHSRIDPVIVYEYPFNESIRTMLRLEHLFDRLGQLVARDSAVDHHFAVATLFEIMDVGSRADLKSDLLKDLDKQRNQLGAFRGNPAISEAALDDVMARVDAAFAALNQMPGKAGAALANNEWLMAIRSRINIPGGTCGFDLPAYYAWQHADPQLRRAELVQWAKGLMPIADALQLLLRLIREAGVPHKMMAVAGQFQQSLPAGKVHLLARLRLEDDAVIPEISGHRLVVTVRMLQPDTEGKLKPSALDTPFELTICT